MDFDATGSFVDNSLMVLVARHQPPLEETDEFGDRIVGTMRNESWMLVASSLQSLLMHPKTETERLALRWVDPTHFNPAVCRHRAQYILWRQRKQLQEKKAASSKKAGPVVEVSDFNVLTSAGLKHEVEQLMADVRSNLPTIVNSGSRGRGGGGDDSDDNDTEEIFRPPSNMIQSEYDVAQAEAEAVLLQQVQDMQLDHYKRYHKWVETSYNPSGAAATVAGGAGGNNYAASHTASAGGCFSSSNNGTPSKGPQQAGAGGGGGNNKNNRSGLVSADDVQDIPLDQCTAGNMSDLLEFLGIPEHQGKFRRTTGRLLLQLKKEDLRERFGEDFEAADVLWNYVEENRVAVPSAAMVAAQKRGGGGGSSAHATVRRLYEDARAPSSALSSQTQNLKAYEASVNPKNATQQQNKMQEMLSKGDLSAIKRSMNPNRPARPSAKQEYYDYSTSEDDVNFGSDYLRGVHGGESNTSSPEKSSRGVSKSMQQTAASYQRPAGGNSETESTTSSNSGGATAGSAAAAGGNPAAAMMTAATGGPRGGGSSYADPTVKKATTTTAPPAGRANRWAVVEYSDDDDTEDNN